MTCPISPPSEIFNKETAFILSSLRDYIGIHRPIFDDNDQIVDGVLIWWNEPYENIRTRPPQLGQSMMATYFEPHIAVDYLREAWQKESVWQIFEISKNTEDSYRPSEVLVCIEVTWLRVGNLIVEIGSDLSEMTSLEIELAAQRQAYSDATHEAILSSERARIGRDLHDSVIQNLFAVALRLQFQNAEPWAVDAIHEVIGEIRQTIFNIEPTSQEPTRSRIEKVIGIFSGAWLVPIETNLSIARELPDDVMNDVENVLREGLSNSARHAKATQVEVDVVVSDDRVSLRISDNGIGPHGMKRRKSGTRSLAQRAESRRGSFTLTARNEGGSLLEWECPID